MLLFENKSKLFPGEKQLITMKVAENKSGMVILLWDMYVFELNFHSLQITKNVKITIEN